MRILHVTQPTTEGVAQMVLHLVRYGVERGHEVVVASPHCDQFSDAVRSCGGTHVTVQMSSAPQVANANAAWILRRLSKRADVVHLHSSVAGLLGRIALTTLARRSRPRVIFTPHGWSWYSSRNLGLFYRFLERTFASVADFVTATSPEELGDGVAQLGKRAELRLIVNGVDTSRYSPNPRIERSATVLCVGRLAEQKGQSRLVEALGHSQGEWQLVLVGDGPDRCSLENLAARLDVRHRVAFLGSVDPLEHLQTCSVFALPSRWEGLPLALLEAMSCQAAVIASITAGASTVGSAGVVMSLEDTDASAQALARELDALMEDPARREALGRAARERVESAFSLAQCLRLHESLWLQTSR